MTIRTPNNSYYVSGASGGQNHTLPFGADRFEDDDLFVYVWNTSTEAWDKKTVTTHYTVSSTQVSFTSSHIPSTRVIVLRKTDVDEDFPKADFVAGASIKAQDLDNNQLQALRGIKELRDQKLSAVPSIAEDGTPSNPKMYANLDMNGYKVVNQPAGYITSTDILDGTIVTADVADSAITAAKLASDSVTTAKIAADAVNGTKIADDSINSEHYVDGSIDTAHIADAQITTAKIADDAVTADKLANTAVTAGSYTAADITVDAQGRVTAASNGAIGTAEITDSAVTTAKIADSNVTTAKIADDAVTTAKIADAELVELATMGGNTAAALADLTQSEVQILDGATVTTAELNILDGVTATATELNQLDGNTLKASSTDFTSSSQFPSASEIDARITARIDPLGGFEAIADEDSFPATAPPAGTVVSIANANGLAVNSSGVGAGTRAGGSDAVVINGFPSTFNSTSLDDGIGLLVIATSTAHTYDFHRVVAKNEDVRQLSSDINDFKARYRIGSSNPTTDNDAGDLFFNTGTSKMLVYNATSSAWEEVQAVGDFFINTISSSSGTGGGSATFNGSAYRFTLSNAPTYAQQLLVSINGVVQKPNSGTSQPSEGFALDGSDIILSAAPASGADFFIITIGSSVGIGTPSDNTVSTAKLVNDAVTGAKIADDAVGAEHIEVLDANLQFADNVKAEFGAGNDLQIYHDGSHSRIVDSGTGSLISQASRFSVHSADNTEVMIDAVENSHVKLYNNNNEKLATKSDGIDVTGEVQCDSLDVDGAADITGVLSSSEEIRVDRSGATNLCFTAKQSGTTNASIKADGSVSFATGNFQVNDDGAILVDRNAATKAILNGYQSSTLTSHILADGSVYFAGDVGIGTTTPDGKLHVHSGSAGSVTANGNADNLVVENSDTGGISILTPDNGFGYIMWGSPTSNEGAILRYRDSDNIFSIGTEDAAGELQFRAGAGSEAMRIDSSGVVKINQSAFNTFRLQNPTSNGANMLIQNSTTGTSTGNGLFFGLGDNEITYLWNYHNEPIIFATNNTERARVTNDGLTFNGDTAAANALNDYEEGTFTPVWQTTGNAFSSVTYTNQDGKYTKIGNIVHVSLRLRSSASSGGSGNLLVGGLPFNCNDSAGSGGGSPATYFIDYHNSTINVATETRVNNNQFYLLSTLDNASWSNVSSGGIQGSGVSEIRVSFDYITDS